MGDLNMFIICTEGLSKEVRITIQERKNEVLILEKSEDEGNQG